LSRLFCPLVRDVPDLRGHCPDTLSSSCPPGCPGGRVGGVEGDALQVAGEGDYPDGVVESGEVPTDSGASKAKATRI
jgi:hypothetical protein